MSLSEDEGDPKADRAVKDPAARADCLRKILLDIMGEVFVLHKEPIE